MPPEACHAICGKRRTASRYSSTFGSGQRAVAADIGAQHVLELRAGVIVHRAPTASSSDCRCQPWVATAGLPPSSSARRRPASGAPRRNASSQARTCSDLRDRRAADHHARDAGVQHLRERGGVAHAAAHLQLDAPCCAASSTMIARLPSCPSRAPSRSTTCSQSAPSSRYLASSSCGSRRIARLGREVALQQPHAAAGSQIDGGNEAHARQRALSRAPENSAAGARRPRRSARDEIARRRNCATARRR